MNTYELGGWQHGFGEITGNGSHQTSSKHADLENESIRQASLVIVLRYYPAHISNPITVTNMQERLEQESILTSTKSSFKASVTWPGGVTRGGGSGQLWDLEIDAFNHLPRGIRKWTREHRLLEMQAKHVQRQSVHAHRYATRRLRP